MNLFKNLKIVLILLFVTSHSAIAANYVITIDGKTYEIEEGQESVLQLSNGEAVKILLEQKAIVTYSAPGIQFDHPREHSPSKTDLGEGVSQTMMATPVGTIILIQEYTTLNPNTLVDYMLSELSAEEEKVGYQFKNTDTEIKAANGITLTGTKSVATYMGEESTRNVVAYGQDNSGVMIITMIDSEAPEKDINMIENFWKTLRLQ